jgi:hypothetical protein
MRVTVRNSTTMGRDPFDAPTAMQLESQDARGSHGLLVSW